MRRLVFATNNCHKLEEVRKIVAGEIEILSLSEINCHEEIPETGTTLEENAFLKAKYVKEKFGYDCFADDTGLEVETLAGAPGVYSARYAGTNGNADANMQKLLEALTGENNREAQFRTVMVLLDKDDMHSFEGIVKGRIAEARKGERGFGYDPVFVPDGFTESFAEMGELEKNKISHRAIALQKLINFLLNKDKQ